MSTPRGIVILEIIEMGNNEFYVVKRILCVRVGSDKKGFMIRHRGQAAVRYTLLALSIVFTGTNYAMLQRVRSVANKIYVGAKQFVGKHKTLSTVGGSGVAYGLYRSAPCKGTKSTATANTVTDRMSSSQEVENKVVNVSLNSQIQKIDRIDQVKKLFASATPKDLFVFDIGNVLLEFSDPNLQSRFDEHPELKKIKESLIEVLKQGPNTREELVKFKSDMRLNAKIQPVEEALNDAIVMLQKRKIKVIGLTALDTGSFGLIKSLEDWRYKQLASLGLDFSSSFDPKKIDLLEVSIERDKVVSHALYYHGILFTNDIPKGLVLKTFLNKIGFKPDRVFFFDNSVKNAASVVKELEGASIPCCAHVYKAASVHKMESDLNIEIARFQYELMKQRTRYVSYFEAKSLLEEQKQATCSLI